jgi:hypothetical protein
MVREALPRGAFVTREEKMRYMSNRIWRRCGIRFESLSAK